MQINNSTQISSVNRALGISLAAFSMFVVGYTASRVYLGQDTNQNSVIEYNITPHQASMWSDLAR